MKRNSAFFLFFFTSMILTLFPLSLAARNNSPDSASLIKELKTLRKLDFKKDVPWQFIDRAELEKNYREAMEKNWPRKEKLLSRWMQLVPNDFDLPSFLSEYIPQSIAGFYSPAAKTLYFSRETKAGQLPDNISKSGIDMSEITGLHEMDHALQDQHFDLKNLEDQVRSIKNDDCAFAINSLIEGDAAYVTLDGMYKKMNIDLLSVRTIDDVIRRLFAGTSGAGKDRKAPYYFQEIIAAPHTEGFHFIKQVIKTGGWDMVNKIYGDLPDSYP